MADALTIQGMIDANVDVNTIEQAATEDMIVTARNGREFPSGPMASRLILEQGTIDATLFKTKADLDTGNALGSETPVSLVDDDFALVFNDANVELNGYYQKQSGAWVYLPYNLQRQALEKIEAVKNESIAYIDSKTQNTSGITQGYEYAFSLADALGNIAIALTNEGVLKVASLDVKEINIDDEIINKNTTTAGNYPANLNHFEVYGQSLSQGAKSTPIQTTSQIYDSLMFSGGIRPEHPSHDVPNFYADFIPLVESADISGYVGYETPLGGATESVKQLIKSENGVDYTQQQYQLLGTACGEGGKSLVALSTTYLDSNLKPAITNAYNLAQSKGMTYAMPAIGWVHGEEDNKPANNVSITEYRNGLQNLVGLIDAHLKTLNPDLKMDKVVTNQLCSFKTSGRAEPHIELAIYQEATKPDNNVYLACPNYIFDYADGYHVRGVSSKWMGAYIGLVYKRVIIDGERWLPIHPISNTRQGKVLEVKFHVPVQPLVIDTEWVAANTNYGFTLVDTQGIEITINSVTITQGDTIKIIADADIPAGAKLRYAWKPASSPNRTTGPRGNIRDSQGKNIIFDPQGINKPMHNWTPIFEYEV